MQPSEPVLEPDGSSDSEEEAGTFTSGREADFQWDWSAAPLSSGARKHQLISSETERNKIK